MTTLSGMVEAMTADPGRSSRRSSMVKPASESASVSRGKRGKWVTGSKACVSVTEVGVQVATRGEARRGVKEGFHESGSQQFQAARCHDGKGKVGGKLPERQRGGWKGGGSACVGVW